MSAPAHRTRGNRDRAARPAPLGRRAERAEPGALVRHRGTPAGAEARHR